VKWLLSLREASSPLRGPASAGGDSRLDLVRLQFVRCCRCAKRRARFAGPPLGAISVVGQCFSISSVWRRGCASPLRGPAACRSRLTFVSGAACPATENVCCGFRPCLALGCGKCLGNVACFFFPEHILLYWAMPFSTCSLRPVPFCAGSLRDATNGW
jgi:hypothetical protein